jgi:hypothetical protein
MHQVRCLAIALITLLITAYSWAGETPDAVSPASSSYVFLKLVSRDGNISYGKIPSSGQTWVKLWSPDLGYEISWAFEDGRIVGLGQCNEHCGAQVTPTPSSYAEYAGALALAKMTGDKWYAYWQPMRDMEARRAQEQRLEDQARLREYEKQQAAAQAPAPASEWRITRALRVLLGRE